MFEKLKNIKFSMKKKGKEEESPADDLFSSSEGDDFFSEPSFGEDDAATDEGLFGEAEGGGDITEEIAAEVPEKKSKKKSKKKKDKSKPASKKGGSGRRTFLLFVLLLVFGSYGAYTYVIPENYPELKKEIDVQIETLTGQASELVDQVSRLISGEAPAEKTEPPKRIAIPKPPTKAIPKPPAKAKEVKPAPKKAPEAKAVKAEAIGEGLEPVGEEVKKPAVEAKAEKKTAPAKPAVKTVKKEVPPAAKPEQKKASAAPKVMAKKPAPVARPKAPARKSVSREKIKVVRASLPVPDKGYYVQAGAFIFKNNLKEPKRKIEALGLRPKVKTGTKLIKMNRLLVGEWGDFLVAEDIAARLRRHGFKAELTSKNERFCVLIGSYYYRNKAERTRKALEAKGFNARIEKKRIRMNINYLLLGPYSSPEKAAEKTRSLGRAGLKTFIIQKK